VVAGRERQDLDHHARLAHQFGQLVELLAHDRGAADHVPQHALMQDMPEHRRVLAVEDRLALEEGVDRAVGGRAGVPRLARTARVPHSAHLCRYRVLPVRHRWFDGIITVSTHQQSVA